MHPWAHDRTRLEQTRQRLDVSGPFAEEMDRGGLGQRPHRGQGSDHGRRWVVDPRVRHDGEELMQARPGDGAATRGDNGSTQSRSRVPYTELDVDTRMAGIRTEMV